MMNYKDDPKVRVFEKGLTEEEIKAEEMDGGCYDFWYGLIEYDDQYAVDFNYYVDGCDNEEVEDYSHFYGCFPNRNGDIVIDCNCCSKEIYEIDFTDPEWKEKLFQAAYEFLINDVLPKEGA